MGWTRQIELGIDPSSFYLVLEVVFVELQLALFEIVVEIRKEDTGEVHMVESIRWWNGYVEILSDILL